MASYVLPPVTTTATLSTNSTYYNIDWNGNAGTFNTMNGFVWNAGAMNATAIGSDAWADVSLGTIAIGRGATANNSIGIYWDEDATVFRYGVGGQTPTERIQQIIRERSTPAIHVRHRSLQPTTDIRELRARQTLRRLIGERKWRLYVTKQFVTITGDSGKTYQLFPGGQMTQVYMKGDYIETLCVVLQGSFPPTDSVLMRYLMILNDETEFRRLANKFNQGAMLGLTVDTRQQLTTGNLAEEFRRLKAAA